MFNKLNKKPVFWYSTGTILRQITAFIMLPIYTNYLTPAEYGIVGLLALFLSIYELFLGARFGVAIPKFYFDEKSKDAKRRLVSTALLFTIGVSIIGAIAFALSSNYLSASFFERDDLNFVFALYGTMLVTSSIEAYGLIYLRLAKQPFYFFLLSVVKLAIQLSLNLYFLIELEMGVSGVIYSGLIASLILAIILGFNTFSYSGFSFDTNTAKRLWIFSWPLWLSGLGVLYITFVTNIILKSFTSLTEVGLYHFALKFSMLITVLFWKPFNQWWQVQRFEIAAESPQPKQEFNAAFTIILAVLSSAVMGVSLFSDVVITLMASDAFIPAVQLVPFLCFCSLLKSLRLFVQFSLFKTDNTKLIPYITYFSAFNVTILVAAGAYFYGLTGAVSALLICQLIEFAVMYRVSKSKYDQGLSGITFASMVTLTGIYIFAICTFAISIPEVEYRLLIYVGSSMIYLITLFVFIYYFSSARLDVREFVKRYF